jgi:phosphoglycerol transferase MdoB-like AlkP superfamily enzyme
LSPFSRRIHQSGDIPIDPSTTQSPDSRITRFLFSALVLVCLVSASCARAPAPPYQLNLAVDGSTPRFFESSRESIVPLTITNTGSRAWDPARVHFSYHWLWGIPRELASRSRTLPYHEGIRTDLPGVITPGARIAIDARVLPPAVPGVYWLQWDMVEEGVTWFAQAAPRRPRRLVFVFPPLSIVLAPLPLVIALGGLILLSRIGRGRRVSVAAAAFAATSDAWWCSAALLSKPLILVREALLEPTAVAYWLVVVAAVLAPLLSVAFLPRRLRAWLLFLIGALGSVTVLGDIVYYRFFGDLLSAPALLGAHQTGHVWGSIRSLLTPGLIWIAIDLPVALWLAVRLTAIGRALPAVRPLVPATVAGLLVVAGVVLGTPCALASARLDQMFRDRAVAEQLGPFGYHLYDFWNYAHATLFRPHATDAQVADAAAWFARRAPLRTGEGSPTFGVARGKNLIVVQVESLQEFAIDYVVDGQEVMPHLRHWRDDTIRFTNVTDQTNQGRTSDAEFAAFASLLPLDQGAVAFRYPGNHYVGLPRVLAEHGYSTLSAVAFESGFWNRAVMHPSYGFARTLFEPDFTMTEQIGWGLNDHDFLQQMVPRLEQMKRPFAAWMITLSLHHPFEDFPARHKVLRLGALEGTSFGNYLHTMHFFDQALDDFKAALARDGLLDDSVLMVFGDHDAGFAHDAKMASAIHVQTDAEWELADSIPWFIRVPRLSAPESSIVDARPAGQTDFAPTLLALLGIDAAPLPYMGRNLLGAPDDPPVLRPYGDWIDRAHLVVSQKSSVPGHACYAIDRGAFADDRDCADGEAAARTAREVSRLLIGGDLQQPIRTRLSQLVQ